MRAVLAVALLLVAGCTGGEEPLVEQAIPPGTLEGTVTDAALLPLAGVNVSVDGANASALTDATGAFRFELLPGEYLVLATHAGHKAGALRASVYSAQSSTLSFRLDPLPRVAPRVEVQEGSGYLACQALLVSGQGRHELPCGADDPNERPTVALGLGGLEGLEAVVIELVWQARTDAASTLRARVQARGDDGLVELGSAFGGSPLPITLAGRLVPSAELLVTVAPEGGLTDEEAGLDAGAALQQPFTVYASAFYHEGPTGAYTAVGPR